MNNARAVGRDGLIDRNFGIVLKLLGVERHFFASSLFLINKLPVYQLKFVC